MRYNKVTLRDLEPSGKTVVLRLDLNVPVKDGQVMNKTRILGSIETIQYLLDRECKVVILSHFDRIKNYDEIADGSKSLLPVAQEIQKIFFNKKVLFINTTSFENVKGTIKNNPKVDIFVLENTRYYDIDPQSKQNVKWESGNNPALAQFYSEIGDIFVNDAFGTSHRAHASNVGVAERSQQSAVGFLIEKELKALNFVLDAPPDGKVMILGGSKVSDKLKLIKEIVNHVSTLIIGGGMAYTFLKAQGKSIGKSLVEDDYLDECSKLLKNYSGKIVLPIDHVVSDSFADIPGRIIEDNSDHWGVGMALDIGPKTIEKFSKILEGAKIVIWNGPLGVFEMSNYSKGTFEILKKLSDLTASKGVYSLIGGGDSVAAAEKKGIADKFSFVSTGGGATLTFLERSSMPGIEAIQNK
ncbi:phosphoglycerate kinase [Candidatus Mycoplasma haematominutum]|uniref:Phosphoglycerate kinase n=1 Tax=Candidatus Mycoplasma haematominutum 'Birmingham 1' TaxID=1116213 RepID=G8C3X9_9MOLU|nr:phosphoglycerate kinase [Candidatus Mycoplasma haematominutum]CCE67027.1 phosphoglycerate kinase [Candidatus Mycoplasma haematominutum 'Birmingham 1']